MVRPALPRPLAGLLGLLCLSGLTPACNEAPTSPLPGLRVPDAGPFDAGGPVFDGGVDVGPDGGVPDVPIIRPDAGPTCRDRTPGGDCRCFSSAPAFGPYLQDDCPDSRDLCVPWDELSQRQDLTGAFQRCARTCLTDDGCEPGEFCAESGAPVGSGAERICVDRLATADQICSNTRALPRESVLVDAEIRAPGVRVGCAPGLECLLGSAFDLHVDEGVCLNRCLSNADCGGDTPYCNPNLFPSPNGPSGVCSEGQRLRGAVCGARDPSRLGLTNQCDTSAATPPETFCIQVGGLLEGEQGICMTVCERDRECPNEGGRPGTCTFFGGGFGICTDSCSNYPEDCEGPGADGAGRVCMDYLGDENGGMVGFCMDRRAPPLVPGRLAADGTLVEMGDNCFPPNGNSAFLQCPESSSCFIIDFNQSIGMCLFGCNAGSTTGNQTCQSLIGMGSTCVDVAMGGGPVSSLGFCSTP